MLQALPGGCRVVSIQDYGNSFWAHSSRVGVELADGTPHSFFLKVAPKEQGQNMLHGKFKSMKAIYAVLPGFAPKPAAYMELPTTYRICIFSSAI